MDNATAKVAMMSEGEGMVKAFRDQTSDLEGRMLVSI